MTDYPSNETDQEMMGCTSAASFDEAAAASALPPFDTAKYRSDLEAFELTGEQERELLETLWSIMHSFVELGFTADVCTAVFGSDEIVADRNPETVDSLSDTFQENSSTDRGPA